MIIKLMKLRMIYLLNNMIGGLTMNKEDFKPSRELKRAISNYWLYAVEHSNAHLNREQRRAKKNGKKNKIQTPGSKL